MRDVVPDEEGVHGGKVQPEFLRDDVQGGAGGQGRVDVAHARVEAEAGVGGGMGFRRDAQGGGVAARIDGDVPVAQLHAFRDTGGAAGVQEDEPLVRVRGRDIGLAFRQERDLPGGQDGAVIAAHQRFQAGIGDEQGRFRILHHEGEALRRVGRVQRLVGAAGLQGAERRHDHILVAVQDDGHHPAGLHGGGDAGGQPVRQLVQLRVGEDGILEDHGRVVRVARDIFAEEVQDGEVGIAGEGFRIESIDFGHLRGRREIEVAHRFGLCHGQETGGEAVRELAKDAFRILVGTVLDVHLERAFGAGRQAEGQGVVAYFGFRVVRAVEGGREARGEFVDTVRVGTTAVRGDAFLLRLLLLEQFVQLFIQGPFHQDGALAAGRGEEGLGVGVPDGDGEAEGRRQKDVRFAGETLQEGFQVLGMEGHGAVQPPHAAFSVRIEVGNRAGIQVGAGRERINKPFVHSDFFESCIFQR